MKQEALWCVTFAHLFLSSFISLSLDYKSKKSINNGYDFFLFFFQAPNIDSETEMRKDKQVEAWLNGGFIS